jgi:antitoxin component YwqK of YwqJK toxin-antitoxin module
MKNRLAYIILFLIKCSVVSGQNFLWHEYQKIISDSSKNDYIQVVDIDSISLKEHLVESRKYSNSKLQSKLIVLSEHNLEQTDYFYDSVGLLSFIRTRDNISPCVTEVRLFYEERKLKMTLCSKFNRLFEVFFEYDNFDKLKAEKEYIDGEAFSTSMYKYFQNGYLKVSTNYKLNDTLFESSNFSDSLITIIYSKSITDTLSVERRMLSNGRLYNVTNEEFDFTKLFSQREISYPTDSDSLIIEKTTTISLGYNKKKPRKTLERNIRVTKRKDYLPFFDLPPCDR